MLWFYSHAGICDWIAEQLYIQSDDCKNVYDVERTANKDFFRLFWIQILIIGIITIVCEAGAFVLGVPVLSMLYNTDLAPYKTELLVLLLGGGFLALSGLFVTIMTIIRIQNSQAIGYGIVAVCAYILSPIFVRKYAVMGASVLYLLLMILLCIIFAIMMMIGFKKKRPDA